MAVQGSHVYPGKGRADELLTGVQRAGIVYQAPGRLVQEA